MPSSAVEVISDVKCNLHPRCPIGKLVDNTTVDVKDNRITALLSLEVLHREDGGRYVCVYRGHNGRDTDLTGVDVDVKGITWALLVFLNFFNCTSVESDRNGLSVKIYLSMVNQPEKRRLQINSLNLLQFIKNSGQFFS